MIYTQLYNKLDNESKSVINKLKLALKRLDNFPFFYKNHYYKQFLFRATFNPFDSTLTKRMVQHPPIKKIKKIGRCNLKHKPVFYAASTLYGALLETSDTFSGKSKKSEIKILSRWKINKPFTILDFYYKTITEQTNEMLVEEIKKKLKEIKKKYLNWKEKECILRFCGDRFAIEGEEAYPFTSLLCNLIYRKEIETNYISGVTYTGAKTDYNFGKNLESYTNVALIPELISNQSLELKDVIKIEINGAPDNDLKIISATEKTKIIEDKIKLIDINNLSETREKEILHIFNIQ